MTKAQALALMTALEGSSVPATAKMTFPAGGEAWAVAVDNGYVLTGAQLVALANYCAANQLVLTAQFSYLGVS